MLLVLMSSLMLPVVLTPHPCAGLLDFRLPRRPFKQLHISQSCRKEITLTEVGPQSLFAVSRASSPSEKMGVNLGSLRQGNQKLTATSSESSVSLDAPREFVYN
jgi:hypothetical protein